MDLAFQPEKFVNLHSLLVQAHTYENKSLLHSECQIEKLNISIPQVVPDAGHSANERGISEELVAGTEKLKYIIKGSAP